jgi:ribosomal protein L37AE/L43A
MSINKIQFQESYCILELFDNYGTDEQCRKALFDWKFKDGFICPGCGSTLFCKLKNRQLYQCNRCHYQMSATSVMIFYGYKLLLNKWFF